MTQGSKNNTIIPFLLLTGLVGWLVPGAGYLLLKEKTRAVILFVTIVLTCGIGLYVGSIGVINPAGARPWYFAQIMNTPLIAILGHITNTRNYHVYGRPCEIGQIYTSIAGLLNLLTIVNSIYLGYLRKIETDGDNNAADS